MRVRGAPRRWWPGPAGDGGPDEVHIGSLAKSEGEAMTAAEHLYEDLTSRVEFKD